MSNKGPILTRRKLLAGAAGAALGGGLAMPMLACANRAEIGEPDPDARRAPWHEPGRKSKVVLIRDERVVDENGRVNEEIHAEMLDRALKELLGEPTVEACWRRLVREEDVVGINSNHATLRISPTFEEALRRRVMVAGVAEEEIGIGDRRVLHDPLFLRTTALINVRPLRTHLWSGIGSCIKNMIMFSTRPASWHDDHCADLAGLWDLPLIKGKTRLNIMVMLTPLFECRGHIFLPQFTWPYRGMIVGLDPVAVDATALRILEAKRTEYFGRRVAMDISPKHVRVAQDKFQLGHYDPDMIDLATMGWPEDSFIDGWT